jgi:hypothetical protein
MFSEEQKVQMRAFRQFVLPFLNSFAEKDTPVAGEAEAE